MIVILINAISSGGCHEIGGGKDSLFGPFGPDAGPENGFGAAVLFVMSSEPVAVAMVINLLVGIMRWRSCCEGERYRRLPKLNQRPAVKTPSCLFLEHFSSASQHISTLNGGRFSISFYRLAVNRMKCCDTPIDSSGHGLSDVF